MLAQFQRMLAYEKTDYYVSVISPFKVYETTFKAMYENLKKNGSGFYSELLPEDEETIRAFVEEEKTDGHGGLMETCLMLAIKSETVRLYIGGSTERSVYSLIEIKTAKRRRERSEKLCVLNETRKTKHS